MYTGPGHAFFFTVSRTGGTPQVLTRSIGQGDTGWQVKSTPAQGSGILSSMADANCFIVLGPAQGNVAEGDTVQVQVLDGLV